MIKTTDHTETDRLLGAFLRKHDPVCAPSKGEIATLSSSIMEAIEQLQIPRVPNAWDLIPFWNLHPGEMLRGVATVIAVMALGYATGSSLPTHTYSTRTNLGVEQISSASWHNFLTIQPSNGEVYYDNN